MPTKKFAISIPEDVMKQVDRAARRRRTTRSGFIADVLRRVASAGSDAEITRRIDEVLSDSNIQSEQRATSEAFLALGPTVDRW